MDTTVVGAFLSATSGLSVMALNSTTSSSGAQLTDYSLTTARVDNNTLTLSGAFQTHLPRLSEVLSKPSSVNMISCAQ